MTLVKNEHLMEEGETEQTSSDISPVYFAGV